VTVIRLEKQMVGFRRPANGMIEDMTEEMMEFVL